MQRTARSRARIALAALPHSQLCTSLPVSAGFLVAIVHNWAR